MTNRADGDCKGECIGNSTQIEVVKGPCPDECSEAILKRLQDAAEKEAQEKADASCFSENCKCVGTLIVLNPGCETHKLADPCGEVCVYHVTVIVQGKCAQKAD
jgi:hypothetical protein